MAELVVGILGKLSKYGAKDIHLLVHSYEQGQASPCYVIENGVKRDFAGSSVDSVEKIFDIEAGKHPGYAVNERVNITERVAGESGTENRQYQTNLESLVSARTEQLRAAVGAVERSYDITLEALSSVLGLRHEETQRHSKRVTAYSIAIARALCVSPDQIRVIARGAFLHDIGKIAVQDEILGKRGALDPKEASAMRAHCQYGYEVTRKIPFLEETSEIVYAHHEKYDGTGYPRALKGDDIPLGAKIVSVANAFDSMVSDQPYRRARSLGAARKEIQGAAGAQFDPAVADAFLGMPESTWSDLRKDIES